MRSSIEIPGDQAVVVAAPGSSKRPGAFPEAAAALAMPRCGAAGSRGVLKAPVAQSGATTGQEASKVALLLCCCQVQLRVLHLLLPPLMPLQPGGHRLQTAGFSSKIWLEPASLLLPLPLVHMPTGSRWRVCLPSSSCSSHLCCSPTRSWCSAPMPCGSSSGAETVLQLQPGGRGRLCVTCCPVCHLHSWNCKHF